MSPRSEEFLAEAGKALREARLLLSEHLTAGAVSRAYYAMLYAARAALSERDRYARSHRGTWASFRAVFVEGERFDPELFTEAQRAQRAREAADYDAAGTPEREAEEIVEQAGRFVDGVRTALSSEPERRPGGR